MTRVTLLNVVTWMLQHARARRLREGILPGPLVTAPMTEGSAIDLGQEDGAAIDLIDGCHWPLARGCEVQWCDATWPQTSSRRFLRQLRHVGRDCRLRFAVVSRSSHK